MNRPNLWLAIFGAIAPGALGVGYGRARQSERHGAAQRAVDDQKAVVAKQDSVVIRDTLILRGKDRIVTRAVTEYRTLRDTFHITDTVLVAAADSAVNSCEDYRNTCRQGTADFLHLRLEHVRLERRYETLVKTPRPRRRWGLGCAGGYGAVVSQGTVAAGPSASCGVAISY